MDEAAEHSTRKQQALHGRVEQLQAQVWIVSVFICIILTFMRCSLAHQHQVARLHTLAQVEQHKQREEGLVRRLREQDADVAHGQDKIQRLEADIAAEKERVLQLEESNRRLQLQDSDVALESVDTFKARADTAEAEAATLRARVEELEAEGAVKAQKLQELEAEVAKKREQTVKKDAALSLAHDALARAQEALR